MKSLKEVRSSDIMAFHNPSVGQSAAKRACTLRVEIARDLGYLSADQFAALDVRLSEVRKLLHGLCNSRSAKAQAAGQN